MNSNRGAQIAGDHAGAHLAGTSSTSTSKGPAVSPDAASIAPRRAVFDQMAQNYSESQAAASWAGHRCRKRDKTPQGQKEDVMDCVTESADASLYSYHSARDLSAFIKEFRGRIFNNRSELYVMPSDDAEFQRLDKQHYAFLLGMDGLFPCADIVHEILSKRDDHGRCQILDLGCGSGIWAIEMAMQFPHCDVIGLDLAPPPVDLGTLPPNLRFEIDDINLGMSHYHGYFDVLHVRCVGAGIGDYGKMQRDVEACLKPGGIVFFIDGDMTCYQEDLVTPVPVAQEKGEGGNPNEGSWLHRMMREIRYAAVYNGCDIDGLEDCIDQGLWDHELIDPSTVRVASLNTPLGTWAKGESCHRQGNKGLTGSIIALTANDLHTQQRLLYVGSLIRQDTVRMSLAWHPILAKYGIPQETLTRWSKRLEEETSSENFRMSLRWRFTWGRRHGKTPSPTLANLNSLDGAGTPVDTAPHPGGSNEYKFLDVYRSKEEAAVSMESRRRKFRKLPETMVTRLRRPTA